MGNDFQVLVKIIIEENLNSVISGQKNPPEFSVFGRLEWSIPSLHLDGDIL